MFEIIFYRDRSGSQPVKKYMVELSKHKDKNSRVNFNKINDYIEALRIHGLQLREPYIKHLEGEIWELRPLKNRILFMGYDGNKFVLLHHFMKKTQKTPQAEIDQAKRNMKDFIERSAKL